MDVLIADDSEVMCQILHDTLTEWGYHVTLAKDGHEAWKILQKPNAPKLLIIDWMMPGLSGIDICQKLRANNNSGYYYVILLTAKTEKDQVYSGLASGADDYLAKPYDPAELKLRLEIGQRILKLERELLDAMSQLKEQEERQNEFFAALTHDLRTPLLAEKNALNSVKAMSPIQWPFQLPNLMNSLVANNTHLLNLVNQLLEKFHLESLPPVQGDKQWVKPGDLFLDCFESLFPLALEKGIKLALHAPLEVCEIAVNPTEMKRVFTNLIANAIEYDPWGTIIDVSVASKNDQVEIIISDNGIGIDTEKVPYIFERYYSGNYNHKVGSGLGLNVCKNIIENYDGHIRVETASNIGTIFYITFPSQSAKSKRNSGIINVLIADDQELARLGFTQMVKSMDNFKVSGVAENGMAVISKVTQLKPDVILMDVKMPEMDGYTATHVVKAAHPEIKIVMMGATPNEREMNAAFNAGADGYCSKDVSAYTLGEALLTVINGERWIDSSLRAIHYNPSSYAA